jgi:6-pyruvoyltetrahydropterin/6-carboxytetrahydropterin synthase
MHGYSLGFRFTFEAEKLDERHWVQDFGGLKEIKAWLDTQFDHTTVIAEDDPMLDRFKAMAGWSNTAELDGKPDEVQAHPVGSLGVIDLRIVPAVGCEAFAEYVYDYVSQWLRDDPTNKYQNLLGDEHPRVKLLSVEVFEHAGNSAIYEG